MAVETQEFQTLALFKRPGSDPIGFHTDRLELASLSEAAWQATRSGDSEALSELFLWAQENFSGQALPARQELTLTINVTQVCNLHCTYCAAGGDGSYGDPVKRISLEKTIPQVKSFFDRLGKGDAFRITFLGGEPLLYPQAIEIIHDFAREEAGLRGIEQHFSVVTNGTLLNADSIRLLRKMKADITISIDGPADINDRTRPTRSGKGTTAKVIEGLSELLKYKQDLGRVGLSGVYGKQQMELEKAYDFFSAFAVDWFRFNFDHSEASPELSAQFSERLSSVSRKAFAKGGEQELRRILDFDRYFSILDNQAPVKHACGAGQDYFVADARNRLYACHWMINRSDEVLGYETHLFEDRIEGYAGSLIEKNGCQSCWARNLCGGGCMFIHDNATGSKHKVDKAFCQRTKDLITEVLFYYEKLRRISA